MSGKKRLSGEDFQLWEHVKKSAKPLRHRRLDPERPKEPEEFVEQKAAKSAKPEKPAVTASAAKAPPALSNFDRRTRNRVARGQIDIGARIDLHGLTLERAHRRLEEFLHDAQDAGVGLALVITGKGRSRIFRDGETGALRREVPMWLAEPRLRALVIGFEEAAPAHGGSGALYVRIRRAR